MGDKTSNSHRIADPMIRELVCAAQDPGEATVGNNLFRKIRVEGRLTHREGLPNVPPLEEITFWAV